METTDTARRRRCQLRGSPGGITRPGWRVGLRKDDNRARSARALSPGPRLGPVRWRGGEHAEGRRAEAVPRPSADDIPGPLRLAEPAHEGRCNHRRTAADARLRLGPGAP